MLKSTVQAFLHGVVSLPEVHLAMIVVTDADGAATVVSNLEPGQVKGVLESLASSVVEPTPPQAQTTSLGGPKRKRKAK